MKRYRVPVAMSVLTVAALTMNGCGIAALAAACSYSDDVRNEDRKEFAMMNLEREKAGLAPLTKEEWETGKKADNAKRPAHRDAPDPT